ncbi:DUF3846 domain-containing protein [uncultured Ruminococcus sp.]|uniref:DUF3846 domain-containing protein n=1 Tax=uncultured Ruminococcus sp. TaxID=165186 RepID=UPI00261A60E5|nr:DUF3846 domain-containing protein [uncultured Ruminococcus sp.]
MNNAIYEVISNGENSYYYTHHGGNCVTGPLRIEQAESFATQQNISVKQAFEMITYSNEFLTDQKGENIFEKISPEQMPLYNRVFEQSNEINAYVTLDLDKNVYRYKENINKYGSAAKNYRLDLREVTNVTKQAVEDCNIAYQDKPYEFTELIRRTDVKLDELNKQRDDVLRVVVVEPGKPAHEQLLDCSEGGKLRAMQKVVDGYIEPLYGYISDTKALAWGNEEARICEMQPNRKFDGKQAICGTFFITGDNGEDSLSLTESQVKKYLEMFKKPDRFTEREIGEAFRCEVHFISFEELTPIQAPERAAAKPKPKGSPKR